MAEAGTQTSQVARGVSLLRSGWHGLERRGKQRHCSVSAPRSRGAAYDRAARPASAEGGVVVDEPRRHLRLGERDGDEHEEGAPGSAELPR